MTLPKAMLDYKETLHKKILEALNQRHNFSSTEVANRHAAWRRAEEDYRAYTPESTEDARRKSKRSSGEIQLTTITIPYTYAMVLTAWTYWTTVFLSRSPILQYEARKGATQQGTQGMEALHDYQIQVGDNIPLLFFWLIDPAKYGVGLIGSYWTTEVKNIAEFKPLEVVNEETGEILLDRTNWKKVVTPLEGYKGNKLYNIRPYDFFPDPRVSLANFQSGEFCSRLTHSGWTAISGSSEYFNLDVLQDKIKRVGGSGDVRTESASPIQSPVIDRQITSSGVGDSHLYALREQYIRLIPKDWELGPETSAELWMFTIAEKEVIIGARPLGAMHDKFPIDIMIYDPEAYSLNPRGIMEIGKDINSGMSWMINSHLFNVRRALNDQIVFDPSRLNAADMLAGGPGKLIRVTPAGYGTPVANMFAQLPIVDVTRSHVNDMQTLAKMLQYVVGINDNVMGSVDPGGRKTATEVRTSTSFAVNRLKANAEFFSATGWSPLSRKLVSNTQQYYEEDEKYRIAGELIQGEPFIQVNPTLIAGEYSFVPVDGTLPVDRYAQSMLWQQLLGTIIQIPGLFELYSVPGIFEWIAQLAGFKNINQFRLDKGGVQGGLVNVQPDEQVQQQAQAGNIIPTGV